MKPYSLTGHSNMDSPLSSVHSPIENTPLCVTQGMHILWEITPSLRAQFDLTTTESKLDYYVYCTEVLRKDLPYLPINCDTDAQKYLHTPAGKGPVRITPYMRHLAASHGYLQSLDLRTVAGRWALWEYALTESGLYEKECEFVRAARKYFREELMQAHPVPGNPGVSLPLVWCLILEKRPDVTASFVTEEELLYWLHTAGAREIAVIPMVEELLSSGAS
jgi:hypothetical protein